MLRHARASFGFVAAGEGQRVQRKKSRIAPFAVGQRREQRGGGIVEAGVAATGEGAKDLCPDAFNGGADERAFGREIIIDGADGNAAGCSHCAHVERAGAMLEQDLLRGFEDFLGRGDLGVHKRLLILKARSATEAELCSVSIIRCFAGFCKENFRTPRAASG